LAEFYGKLEIQWQRTDYTAWLEILQDVEHCGLPVQQLHRKWSFFIL